MSRISPRERILLVICVAFVVVAVWIEATPRKTGSAPKLLTIDAANHKRDVAIHTIARLAADTADLKPKLDQALFDDAPEALVPRLVGTLQEVAERAGVHLSEIKPLPATPLDTVQGTRVSLDVRFTVTSQKRLMRFLYFVEDPAGKMDLDRLSVSAGDAATGAVEVSARVSVFTRSTDVGGVEGG